MSKLNKNPVLKRVVTAPYGLGVSGNGNVQFNKGSYQELFEILVSTLYGKDSYYESTDKTVARMKKALNTIVTEDGLQGAEFAGRAAKFAREQMYIRTMPIVMVVELTKILQVRNVQFQSFMDKLRIQDNLAKQGKAIEGVSIKEIDVFYNGTNSDIKDSIVTDLKTLHDLGLSLLAAPPKINLRELTSSVISRVDELTDMYAYALTVFGGTKNIPMALRRGVADAFNKFDAYQFGKYNCNGSLTLKDLLRIVHPIPDNKDQSAIFKKIMDETLETPYTWETELSANGQLGDKRKSAAVLWAELVTREGSGSLGYMALLRNLRNMAEAKVDNSIWKLVAQKIRDKKSVAKSKQLPFGFINAYDFAAAAGVPSAVLNAIQDATEQSLGNLPKLGENVWIIVDGSGSMNFSHETKNAPIKTAAIFAAALVKAAKDSFNCKVTIFDDYARDVKLNPKDSIFTMYQAIMARNAGGGTNLESALKLKHLLGFEPDTVIILSDMEINSLSTGRNIDSLFAKDCVKVAVNLASRDTTPLGEWHGWTQLAGFSPRIFQYVQLTRDSKSIVQALFDNTLKSADQLTEEELEF